MIYGDPREMLGLPPEADKRQAKQAYRALARRYHPDVDSSPEASERWLEITWAWEMIANDRPLPLLAEPARWDYVLASLFSEPRRIEVEVAGPLGAGSTLEIPVAGEQRTVVLGADSGPGKVLRLAIDDQEFFLFLRQVSESSPESSG